MAIGDELNAASSLKVGEGAARQIYQCHPAHLSVDECLRATRMTLGLIQRNAERALEQLDRGELEHPDITCSITSIMDCMEVLPAAYIHFLQIRSCAGQA